MLDLDLSVTEAENGKDRFLQSTNELPDLILLDLMMRNGPFQFMKKLNY